MRFHLPVVSSIIIVISLFVYLFDGLSSMFIYDRDVILDGEFWRLITGHFVHFSGLHFSFNIIAFGITGWIIEKRAYPGFGMLVLIMAFVIGVSMIVLKPDMQFYGGLSGISHGALIYLALFGLREAKPWNTISWVILLFVPIKVGIEMFTGGLLAYRAETFVPVPLSHLMGVVVAFLQFYILKTLERKQVENRK